MTKQEIIKYRLVATIDSRFWQEFFIDIKEAILKAIEVKFKVPDAKITLEKYINGAYECDLNIKTGETIYD